VRFLIASIHGLVVEERPVFVLVGARLQRRMRLIAAAATQLFAGGIPRRFAFDVMGGVGGDGDRELLRAPPGGAADSER
jgi:hypothetical protein